MEHQLVTKTSDNPDLPSASSVSESSFDSSQDSESLLGTSSSEDDSDNDSAVKESKEPQPTKPQREKESAARVAARAPAMLGWSRGFKRKKKYHGVNTGLSRQKRAYYGSDNSYESGVEEKRVADFHQTMDFQLHARKKWGGIPLFDNLAEEDFADLVGFTVTQGDTVLAKAIHNAGQNHCQQNFERERSAFNPLYGQDQPLPDLEFLQHITTAMSEHSEFCPSLDDAFDTSAILATAISVEEMMTSSMMPLAGLHAARCRELETVSGPQGGVFEASHEKVVRHSVTGAKIAYDSRLVDRTASAFDSWAMPVEEALCALLEQGFCSENDMSMISYPDAVLEVSEEGNPVIKAIGDEVPRPSIFSGKSRTILHNDPTFLPLFECQKDPPKSAYLEDGYAHSEVIHNIERRHPEEETKMGIYNGGSELGSCAEEEGTHAFEEFTHLHVLSTQQSQALSTQSDEYSTSLLPASQPMIPLAQLSESQTQSSDNLTTNLPTGFPAHNDDEVVERPTDSTNRVSVPNEIATSMNSTGSPEDSQATAISNKRRKL